MNFKSPREWYVEFIVDQIFIINNIHRLEIFVCVSLLIFNLYNCPTSNLVCKRNLWNANVWNDGPVMLILHRNWCSDILIL